MNILLHEGTRQHPAPGDAAVGDTIHPTPAKSTRTALKQTSAQAPGQAQLDRIAIRHRLTFDASWETA